MTRRPVIAAAKRTVFGRNRGGLSAIRPDDLLGLTLQELLAATPTLDPVRIDDVIMGDANGAGEDNRNVARMGALLAGLPTSVPGVTLNRLCGSGAEAMVQAARAVRSGDMDIVIAGGVESMSRAPYVLPKPDRALDPGMGLEQTTVGWRMVNPKFPAHWTRSLGACAESTAARRNIGREAQDAWALRSHQRVAKAWAEGKHDGFAFAVGDATRDECVRDDATAASLAALKPAFTPDGSVTAGNSSPINDGAVATLVVEESLVDVLGLEPIGAILGSAVIAGEPDDFAAAPVPAMTSTSSAVSQTQRSPPAMSDCSCAMPPSREEAARAIDWRASDSCSIRRWMSSRVGPKMRRLAAVGSPEATRLMICLTSARTRSNVARASVSGAKLSAAGGSSAASSPSSTSSCAER